MLNLSLKTGPAVEPVSLATAKQHCRVEIDDDDALISLYISAAREYAENRLNRALVAQTWVLSLDSFPYCFGDRRLGDARSTNWERGYWFPGMSIRLPKPPCIEVTSITYTDSTGKQVTLDPSTYVVDTLAEPALITPAVGSYWPFSQAFQPGSVQVTYVAGYGTDATEVPNRVGLAILLLVGHFYANREATSQGVAITNVPMAVDALLASSSFLGFSFGH